MSIADSNPKNKTLFLMGNEAIARGALEAGLQFAAGYPGTPSSEILQNLANVAKKVNIHAEWSINEKVASESAGAAAFAGLKSIATMKNAGLSVALDFLVHISYSELGNRGGAMVVAVCDDPDGHSSGDEHRTSEESGHVNGVSIRHRKNQSYRPRRMTGYRDHLHLGITEAGGLRGGTVKSAV